MGLRPPSLGQGRSGGHQGLGGWAVIEGHEGRAPQGTEPRLKAKETQKLEKICSQHWELVTFTGGRVCLTLLGLSRGRWASENAQVFRTCPEQP